MNCKRCGMEGIDDEAYNAPSGGFLCRSCYRRLQWKCVGIGLAIAAIGIIVSIIFIGAMLLKHWPEAN